MAVLCSCSDETLASSEMAATQPATACAATLTIMADGDSISRGIGGLIDNCVDGDLVSGSVGSPVVIRKVDVSGANTM